MNGFNNVWTIWLRHLGHLNNTTFIFLFKLGCLDKSVTSIMFSTFAKSKCESCCLSKRHVFPFPIHYSCAIAPFDVFHTNFLGITPHLSRLGYKYYVTFIDDQYHHTWIYFLKYKYKVFSIFQKFYNMVSIQFQKPIKILCSGTGENTCLPNLPPF